MDIHIAQSASHEFLIFDKSEHFFMGGHGRLRNRLQKSENFASVLQLSAGQFSDDKWMSNDFAASQEFFEMRMAGAKMQNP